MDYSIYASLVVSIVATIIALLAGIAAARSARAAEISAETMREQARQELAAYWRERLLTESVRSGAVRRGPLLVDAAGRSLSVLARMPQSLHAQGYNLLKDALVLASLPEFEFFGAVEDHLFSSGCKVEEDAYLALGILKEGGCHHTPPHWFAELAADLRNSGIEVKRQTG